MRIFLIGFMGSGKSYTGRRLAQKTRLPFIDLDEWIEKKEGKSIRAIFEQEGEVYFRLLEKESLREMEQYPHVVVSCGGGTPCFHGNMEWMNSQGVTIYLRAPESLLARRLAGQQAQRPLLKGQGQDSLELFIRSRLEERERYYMESSIVYDQCTEKEPVAENILRYFQDMIGH